MQLADKINIAIAIATGLSVVVSAVMAIMTFLILRANRATVEVMRGQIEAVSRPYVQITPVIRPMTSAIELHIKNVGTSAASRLRLTLDRDYQFNGEDGPNHNLRNYTAFSKEIQMLAPEAEFRFLLGVGHRILNRPNVCPLQFTVSAEYSFEGKTVNEITAIDLEAFGMSCQTTDPMVERMDKLISELKAIRLKLPTED